MTNKLYIDGIDAYSEYGVFVHETGYNDLVSFPALKKVESNDWPEEDGIEVDLENPRLDKKEFKIMFGCVNNAELPYFIDALSDGAYHTFDFAEIGATRKLRLVNQVDKNSLRTLEKFSLQFCDDFPLYEYEYMSPIGYNGLQPSGHTIDGVDLSDYGLLLLAGSHDNIVKLPAVKPNLLTSNAGTNGAIYDAQNVFFKEKDVTLKLCARAGSFVDFWHNYNALLYDLTRKDTRRFHYSVTDKKYPCYYKDSKVSRFTFSDTSVWCEFTLTLVFI